MVWQRRTLGLEEMEADDPLLLLLKQLKEGKEGLFIYTGLIRERKTGRERDTSDDKKQN